MSKSERGPRLTAARKFELYLATRSPDAPLGEISRQNGRSNSNKGWPKRRTPWQS